MRVEMPLKMGKNKHAHQILVLFGLDECGAHGIEEMLPGPIKTLPPFTIPAVQDAKHFGENVPQDAGGRVSWRDVDALGEAEVSGLSAAEVAHRSSEGLGGGASEHKNESAVHAPKVLSIENDVLTAFDGTADLAGVAFPASARLGTLGCRTEQTAGEPVAQIENHVRVRIVERILDPWPSDLASVQGIDGSTGKLEQFLFEMELPLAEELCGLRQVFIVAMRNKDEGFHFAITPEKAQAGPILP
jgi:hypothetical protein